MPFESFYADPTGPAAHRGAARRRRAHGTDSGHSCAADDCRFFSSLQQQTAERSIDIPVPRGRRVGGGGLQGFLPAQNSTAQVSLKIVDILVPSGSPHLDRGSADSLAVSRDEAFHVFFFALFPDFKKKKKSAHSAAGVVSHSSSWTLSLLEAELEEGDPDCWRDEYGRLWVQLVSFPGRWYLTCPGRDGDIFWDEHGWGSFGLVRHGFR